MADSRSKRRGEDLPLPPRPPRRPPPQQPRGQTEEEIMRDRSGLDSRFREPMMTNEDPGYIMGGPQMTDPYNFEYMRRQKEKRESEGIRLKKGGPVKKYEGGGMVQIEIKVGGGGKRKGKHKMPDGSMMEDEEHEAEEYRKGGRIRKYAEGGEVSPRSGLKAQLQRSRARTQGLMETPENYLAPRDATPMRAKSRSMFSTSRESDPIRQREREQTRREQDYRNRVNSAIEREYATQSELESQLDKDQEQSRPKNYKKGGAVKGGKFIQGAIKKPGALRAQLGAKPGQNIPAKKLAAAAKAPGKLGQRARFAQTLAKMKKGK